MEVEEAGVTAPGPSATHLRVDLVMEALLNPWPLVAVVVAPTEEPAEDRLISS